MQKSFEDHPVESPATTSRRRFLAWLAGSAVALLVTPGVQAAEPHCPMGPGGQGTHPDPRPGIDASKVLAADKLKGDQELIELFDKVREIPHIADGIRCHCGCATIPGYRSLLSCYEGAGMAQHCLICQGQARLAHRRFKEGQTLDQIRRAIDARFGDGG